MWNFCFIVRICFSEGRQLGPLPSTPSIKHSRLRQFFHFLPLIFIVIYDVIDSFGLKISEYFQCTNWWGEIFLHNWIKKCLISMIFPGQNSSVTRPKIIQSLDTQRNSLKSPWVRRYFELLKVRQVNNDMSSNYWRWRAYKLCLMIINIQSNQITLYPNWNIKKELTERERTKEEERKSPQKINNL